MRGRATAILAPLALQFAACGGPAKEGGAGADCFRATECQQGLVCIDHKTAAYHYGQELKACHICGRDLTDERSRYYSIGPDCETRHESFIWYVEEQKGMSYEQARAQLLV